MINEYRLRNLCEVLGWRDWMFIRY